MATISLLCKMTAATIHRWPLFEGGVFDWCGYYSKTGRFTVVHKQIYRAHNNGVSQVI